MRIDPFPFLFFLFIEVIDFVLIRLVCVFVFRGVIAIFVSTVASFVLLLTTLLRTWAAVSPLISIKFSKFP